jgi:hypothetical protein
MTTEVPEQSYNLSESKRSSVQYRISNTGKSGPGGI